jgi:multiple sugar transport system substrate-binding protein
MAPPKYGHPMVSFDRDKRHSRRLLYILAYLLALVPLAGCNWLPIPAPSLPVESTPTASSSPTHQSVLSPTPSATAPPVSQIGIDAADLRGQLIRFWHPWTGPNGKAISSLVEQFNLSNPWGILVTPVAFSGYDDLDANFASAQSTVDAPQISVGLQYQALTWDKSEPLVDLQAYFNDPEWGLSPAEQEDFYSLFLEQDIVDGRRIGFPAIRSAQLLFYNQTWGKELGFQVPPATPEQFNQQACAAAKANLSDASAENDGTGGWIVSTDPGAVLGWIYAFGGEFLKSPEPTLGQTIYNFNTPLNEKAFTYLRKMYDDGCAWQSQNQVPDQAFAQRQGLFATGSVIDIPFQQKAFKEIDSRDQWTVLPFPSPALNPSLDIYGSSYFVFSASPQQQLAAWLFIRWLSSSQNHAYLVEASGAFPLRKSELDYLQAYSQRYPQWTSALDLLKYARPEPAYSSWGKVRRSLDDAATQLFRSYFTAEQIPVLLDYLDQFAAELHVGIDLESTFATTTPTPDPHARPTRTPKPSLSPTDQTRTPTSIPTP